MARMTLWGMYQYDPTLMDGVQVPDGASKDLLINSIMERSGDLYPYYQVPERLKTNIIGWFECHKTDLKRIWIALTAEYNPIHNYDRTEERTLNRSETVMESGSNQQSGTDTTTGTASSTGQNKNSGTDVHTIDASADSKNETTGTDSGTTGGTQEQTVSAYDASTYVPREKNVTSGTESSNNHTLQEGLTHDHSQDSMQHGLVTDITGSSNNSSSITYGKKDVTDRDIDRHGNDHEILHASGNIGVTTNQKMITDELELRKNNWYDIVCELFEEHFLIQVY